MSANSEEKRHYSRVATNIQAWLRPLPSPDAPPLFNDATSLLRSDAPQALQDTRLPEGLLHFLLDMDRKLHAILGLLGRDQLLEDFPIRATISEISGAGVRLVDPVEPLPLDTSMEIVIGLSQMPLRLAGAIGKAVRQDPDEEQRPASFAFEFTRIREPELDAIIGFVLQEERRHIRERKWD